MIHDTKIPPRGTANVTELIVSVPHGWEYRAKITNLARSGSPDIPDDLYPYVVLWTHISQLLDARDMDLHAAIDNLSRGK